MHENPGPTAGTEKSACREPQRWISKATTSWAVYYNQSVKFFYNKSGKLISPIWRQRDRLVVGLGLTVCVIVILANILVMTAIHHQPPLPLPNLLPAGQPGGGGGPLRGNPPTCT
ncbi:hypothetical protein SKAU_G00117490 [Synaphobranchus kaupii]|uniref:Uncharacterized protein n=1 Tax=Synaphobranchus kaupii TaxID=118154 RepID=A0A9Q1FNN2_SYNKA|nr:hypothetical protein SKAU_G00117490 [Synaphobranchus kaupii]